MESIIDTIKPALASTYAFSTAEVVECPDLHNPPYHLASQGLCGNPIIADVGGPTNLYPRPVLDRIYSMTSIAKEQLHMSPNQGMLIGAGAGPFHFVGQNAELAANISWKNGFDNVTNLTHYTKIDKSAPGPGPSPLCEKCASTDCAFIVNMFGSSGLPGPVIKVTARKRVGSTNSFIDVIRFALRERFGDQQAVSLGGLFVIRKGKANFHVMPDFPPEEKMPFKSPQELLDWLTYHDFSVKGAGDEIVCLSVLHSADPEKKMGVRLEHTHCFSADGRGGHYHYDLDDQDEDIEYEGYFNVAETIYRVDRPDTTLGRDLHE